jgi:hypothetical protein
MSSGLLISAKRHGMFAVLRSAAGGYSESADHIASDECAKLLAALRFIMGGSTDEIEDEFYVAFWQGFYGALDRMAIVP